MSGSPITLDPKGLTLHVGTGDTELALDVYCDDQHVWSATVPEDSEAPVFVAWPRPMRPFLDGVAVFRIQAGDEVLYDQETRFGAGDGRIAFRDRSGIPIMIDKWGLIQRPFTGRGRGVIEQMVEVTEEIIAILAEECDVHAWIAFGTLLGAARSGEVIGHDSDVDLAYVSRQPTPAAMAVEMFDMTRALRRHGMKVLPKSGSFITVVFPAPDGGSASIDIYTCLYVGDLLHETATVRAAVPRSAIEPLGTMMFEGRPLQAPADPEALLVASYGPNWRTPDPSFKHEPGPEILRRFDGWFGSLMRNRRDWERTLRLAREQEGLAVSDFAAWVAGRLDPDASVVEVGAGLGADALHLAGAGHRVTALDYARGTTRAAAKKARADDLPLSYLSMNLYDLRDVLSQTGLLLAGEAPPTALVARDLLPALGPDATENFWRMAGLLLRRGGTAYLEILPGTGPTAGGARRRRVAAAEVERDARAAGATRIAHETGPTERWVLDWAPANRTDDEEGRP